MFTATGQGLASVYDRAGRLTSATSFGRTLTYLYDTASNRTRLTFPDALYAQYDYDALGRVTAIRENGASSGLGVLATYAYDDLSRRVTVTRGNGLVTSHNYEGDGLPDTLVHNAVGTAHDVTFGFDYNRVNQMTARSISNGLYVWDGGYNANRSYTVNGLNQYVTAGPRAFSYDANGNLTSDGVWSFGFDTENRWISATGGGATVDLAYDPAGRLRQLTADGTTTQFLYDGDALVAEYNGSGTLLRRYVNGSGIDEPVVWYEGGSTGDRRWLLADHQGSIIGQANASGVVTQTYTYGPYGEPNVTAGSRFRYTGQIIVPEVGLYHYKARAYSPYLGRFLQTDPIGYEDQVNLYAYVHNNPVNMVDSSGQEAACITLNTGCGMGGSHDVAAAFLLGGASYPRHLAIAAQHSINLTGLAGVEAQNRARLINQLIGRGLNFASNNRGVVMDNFSSLAKMILTKETGAFIAGRIAVGGMVSKAGGGKVGSGLTSAAVMGGAVQAVNGVASQLESNGISTDSLSDHALATIAGAGAMGATVSFDAKSGNITASVKMQEAGSRIERVHSVTICNVNSEKGC